MNSPGNDMNINHKETEKWEMERWDHWASQHTDKLDKSGIAKPISSSWRFSSLKYIIRAVSKPNSQAQLWYMPFLCWGLQSWMQLQVGSHKNGAEGQNPLPSLLPVVRDEPRTHLPFWALSALGHVETHLILLLRAALKPFKGAKVFLYKDHLLSPLSLVFHSKFSLKGFPVTHKHLKASASIAASRSI